MTAQEVFATVLRLSHSWRTSSAIPATDLAAGRRAIAQTLLRDQPGIFVLDEGPPPPADVALAVLSDVGSAISEAEAELARLGPSIPSRVFVRPTPILTHHDPASIPPWAAGRARVASFGPFVDDLGCEWWVDTYDDAVPYITFAHNPNGSPLVLIPHESAFRGADTIELAEGTVWIASHAFSSSAPAGYVGLRIVGGTLSLDGPTQGSNPIVLDPQGSVTLDLDLVSQTESGPGSNGATFPAHATVHVSPAGVDAVETADLSIALDGVTYGLGRNAGPVRFEQSIGSVVIPYDVAARDLTLQNPGEPLYAIGGTATVEGGAWTIPLTHSPPFDLGEASGIGALALAVGPGLTATWGGLVGGPVRLRRSFIEVSPGVVTIVAPATDTRRNVARVDLWDEARTKRRSSIDVGFGPAHALKLFKVSSNVDVIVSAAHIVAHLDRPLYASGRRPGFARTETPVRWLRDARGQRIHILNRIAIATYSFAGLPAVVLPLAISNALLRTTGAGALFLGGLLDQNADARAGTLVLAYGLHDVIPILPDPYAANLDAPTLPRYGSPRAGLLATVSWTEPAAAQLAVAFAARFVVDEPLSALLPRPRQAAPVQSDDLNGAAMRGLFDESAGARAPEDLRLLDLSSKADQLGVGVGFRPSRTVLRPELTIQDFDLATTGANLRVFMLPQVQWEPVVTPQVSSIPFPEKLFSVDDGGPSLIGANTVRLVPIAPVPLADEVVQALGAGDSSGALLFTLPFGIKAVATLQSAEDPGTRPSSLRYVRPEFGSLAGGRQFRLEAGFVPNDGRSIPGASVQLTNATSRVDPTRLSVLDNNASGGGFSTRHLFNNTFAPGSPTRGVPISRIDLSGYGESGVSHWTNKTLSSAPKITEARFDVVVGRTAYEVVQEMSICWPSQAVFVRTITMERKGNARVVRFDSGWDAATPGVFRLPDFAGVFHPGVIKGYYNITSIREVGALVEAQGAVFQPVLFNADAAIENVTAGHRAKGLDANGEPVFLVPARDVVGYVQRLPQAVLTPLQLAALFTRQGPIGGAVDCEIDVGRSGLHMRVTGAHAELVAGNAFAVAARGMPRLPRSGQWSVTRTDNMFNGAEDHEPQPVDRTAAVPLIRTGETTLPNSANPNPFRFADPADLLNPAPAFDYGLLFATEVFRVLFLRPRIDVDASHVGRKQLASDVRPLLADPYAVVTTATVFPKAKQCLRFPNIPPLDILPGDNLRFPPVRFKVEPFRVREQVKTSNWRMALEYADETGGRLTDVRLTLDSTATPPATLEMSPLNVVVDTGPFKGLMRVVGTLEAKSPAAIANPSVVLGSALAPVGAIITVLNDLGLPFAMAASIAASDEKSLIFKQTIHIDIIQVLRKILGLPVDKKEHSLDLGWGKIKGEIEVGIFISLSGRTHAGVFCKIIGELQQAIIGKALYAGGHMALEFAFELEEKEVNGQKILKDDTKIELTAAVVGSVGGDLIPKLLRGEAAVRKGYLLEIDLVSGKIKPGVMLGMEVEAEVVSGLVAVGFEWEGKGLMTRHGDKIHIDAEVTAAVSVTLAFYLETTIEIEGKFEMQLDQKVVAGLLIAFGIIPI